MNILITGGAGYIGTTLIPQLLKRGHRLTVLDNLLFGGEALFPFFRHPRFDFVNGDIRDEALMRQSLVTADIVIHLAAIVGFPACRKEPELAESVNINGCKLLSSLASNQQIILYGSTGSNYGEVKGICTESTPLNPLSLYGESKSYGEQYFMDNNPTIAYRFATAFGVSPRLRLDLLVNDFTYKAMTQGYVVVYESSAMRTFIHVHDIARAWLFAVDNLETMEGEIYNVGSDSMNCTKKEICKMIEKHTGAYFHYADIGEDIDKRDYVVSYKKITELGFETTISIEEGIDELVKATSAVVFRTPFTNT